MKVRNLGYVGFESPADQVKQWEEFGPELLGLGLFEGHSTDGSVYLRMDDRHHRWAIHPGPVSRLAYAGWELKGEDDFAGALEHLERHGVPFTRATDEQLEDRCVTGMVRLTDPAGFVHELFYGQGARYRSFLPGRNHQGFVTGDQGMGHLVVVAPEYEEFDAFITGIMGFPNMLGGGLMRIPGLGAIGFYRCTGGSRHHTLGNLGLGTARGVHHVMIQNEDLDDVGFAWTMAKDRGLHIPIDLGRHVDGVLSFYIETPSGFFIEYAWGGIRLDEEYLRNEVTERHFGGGEPGSIWGHKTSAGLPEALTMPSNLQTT
ncbi:UNVERIFIED_CONTAM: VOC family protein [Mycobacterium avium subsp. hominissuis]